MSTQNTDQVAGGRSLSRIVGRVPVIVWAALVVATLVSYAGAEHLIDNRTLAAPVVLGVGLIKVRLVGLHFMELRHAPAPLRLVFEAYVVVTFAVLIVLYLVI